MLNRGYQSKSIVAAALLLIAHAVVVYGFQWREITPDWIPLANFPETIASWQTVRTLYMDAPTAALLKPDDYMSRTLEDRVSHTQVNVFVAYFKSLRTSSGPHSPSVCLPGAGWVPVENSVLEIPPTETSRAPLAVNRYALQKGNERIQALYWYQTAAHSYAEEYVGKYYLFSDFLKYRRSDLCLIRLLIDSRAIENSAEMQKSFDLARKIHAGVATHLMPLN